MPTATTTYTPKLSEIRRGWRVIDASGRTVGRVATEIAGVLKGKDKPTYTPNLDTGDFVIVVNASKIRVTSKKLRDKIYYSHSGYPGGLREMSLEQMLAKHPRRVIERAVWGMLPKNSLGRRLIRKLKVYAEATHPHAAQAKELAAQPKAGKAGKPRKQRAEPAPAQTSGPRPEGSATVPAEGSVQSPGPS